MKNHAYDRDAGVWEVHKASAEMYSLNRTKIYYMEKGDQLVSGPSEIGHRKLVEAAL